jgi:hypothetical protein
MNLPSKSPITLAFGSTDAPYSASSPHKGTDFSCVPDDQIYAPVAGQVILRPNNGNDGDGIYVWNGSDFHGLLHSSQYLVKDGDSVSEGQPLGVMGDTGYAFGRHLHWCIKRNGVFIDPMSLISKPQGGMLMVDKNMLNNLYLAVFDRQPDPAADGWLGQPADVVLQKLLDSDEYAQRRVHLAQLQSDASSGSLLTIEKENNSLLKKLLSIFNIK